MSSLQVSKIKPEIWFNQNTLKAKWNILVGYFDFKVVSSFGKYLGTYIDGHHRKQDIVREVITKISKKLEGWKVRLLSQAGRVILYRIVLQNLPINQMSMVRFTKA